MKRYTFLKLTTALATGLLLNATAHAQTTTINVAAFADFAGPYANVMPQMQGGRLAVIEWWNKEVGSKLNVQIVVKTFDTRYDVAQTASSWPGIKAEVKPALLLGLGGPDAAALQQRLPEDKIPMLMATATYGFGWKPNQWSYLCPTYAHEAAGFLERSHHQTPEQAPCQGGNHHLRSHSRLRRHGQGPAKLRQGQPRQGHLCRGRSGPKCNWSAPDPGGAPPVNAGTACDP